MRAAFVLAILATVSALALTPAGEGVPQKRGTDTRSVQLPEPEGQASLPPLPGTSPRVASYSIDARLDAIRHEIQGRLTLDWRNDTRAPRQRFPFHLYWNAFRDRRSTHLREWGERVGDTRISGQIDLDSVTLLAPEATDLTPTLRFIQCESHNADDRTLVEVRTPRPVLPGETVRFEIRWRGQVPSGFGRSDWVHDYHFVAQWFPKIAGIWKGDWNAHQFHAWSEFFADFGSYDVRLTVPEDLVVGATGRLEGETQNDDGTRTLRFVQEDVHDFAWTASSRFLVRETEFRESGYPPVRIRLLLQPEHAHLARRYLDAAAIGLRSFGAWCFPYPYRQLTIVDPAWGSGSGGMEYPTLITGGTSVWAPETLQSPESVTVHEVGHQFLYGVVATNELHEAWMDEGMTSYLTAKALWIAKGPEGWGRRYFGLGERSRSGWPVVAPGVHRARGADRLPGLRRAGTSDPMARSAWEYRTRQSYGVNSYGKPELTLQTLEGLVGDQIMTRILRTYARRYAFRHPEAADFVAVVREVTGEDYGWFFDETWFSSELCDYAIEVREHAGADDGAPVRVTEVTVRRLGGVRLPVEVRVDFEDGSVSRETWDGRERWRRFRYDDKLVTSAVVDPDGRLALDTDPANDSWVRERGTAPRAAAKWSGRWLLWLQNLLETHAFLG